MRRSARSPTAALAVLVLVGCKASASLNLSTSASRATAGEVEARAPEVRIVRRGDRLLYENGEIEFETGSSALVGDSTVDVIARYAVVLEHHPALKIRIEGHTDSRGGTAANQRLSEERARAIKAALVRRGVSGARLDTRGFGETQPERVEPAACRNRSEETVADGKLAECQQIWTSNRRAGFVVTEGADSLPPDGAAVSDARDEPVPEARPSRRAPPDWALRMFGGYAHSGLLLHGGHLGVGVHASQRFGARRRGYIGGGPRLHYRGVRDREDSSQFAYEVGVHQFGPEGDLLLGGGSARVVGLFSLRLGLGMSVTRGHGRDGMTTSRLDDLALAGWLLGGVTVLGKITPRWSLGGHAEAGITGTPAGGVGFVTEVGLNAAWHFGRGRRDGI